MDSDLGFRTCFCGFCGGVRQTAECALATELALLPWGSLTGWAAARPGAAGGGRRWGGLGLGGLLGGALEFAGFFRDSMDGKVGIRGCDPAGAKAQLYFQLLAA